MAQRIEERVRERVAAALDSAEVQKQIEARLREERAALEQKVTPSACAVPPRDHDKPATACLHAHAKPPMTGMRWRSSAAMMRSAFCSGRGSHDVSATQDTGAVAIQCGRLVT